MRLMLNERKLVQKIGRGRWSGVDFQLGALSGQGSGVNGEDQQQQIGKPQLFFSNEPNGVNIPPGYK